MGAADAGLRTNARRRRKISSASGVVGWAGPGDTERAGILRGGAALRLEGGRVAAGQVRMTAAARAGLPYVGKTRRLPSTPVSENGQTRP